MKLVESLEYSGLVINGVNETNKIETKEQKGGFIDMLLGFMLIGKYVCRKRKIRSGGGVIRAGEGINKGTQDF